MFTHRKCLQTESGRAAYSVKIGRRPFQIPLLFAPLEKKLVTAEGALLLEEPQGVQREAMPWAGLPGYWAEASAAWLGGGVGIY